LRLRRPDRKQINSQLGFVEAVIRASDSENVALRSPADVPRRTARVLAYASSVAPPAPPVNDTCGRQLA